MSTAAIILENRLGDYHVIITSKSNQSAWKNLIITYVIILGLPKVRLHTAIRRERLVSSRVGTR